jgi:uncharacterized phage-associated protein
MAVEFTFNFPRSLAVLTYIASKNITDLSIYRLLKIVFLADRQHLLRYGRTITGDQYCALPDGPVPSRLYDLLKKQVVEGKKPFSSEGRLLVANLKITKPAKYDLFAAKRAPDMDELSRTEVAAIDDAIMKFRSASFNDIKRITHGTAEFDKAWKSKPPTARRASMRFEDVFEDRSASKEARAEMIEADSVRKAFA